MSHKEILEEVLKEKEDGRWEEKKQIVRRASIVIMSLLMLYLFLSYLVPSYGFYRFLQGQIDSYEVEGNSIWLENEEVIILEGTTYLELRNMFDENKGVEFKACLLGEKINNQYRAYSIEIPEIIAQTFTSVRAKPCPPGTIIDLHSHPEGSCLFSLHDLSVYRYMKNLDQDGIIMIMCEKDRFNVHGFQ